MNDLNFLLDLLIQGLDQKNYKLGSLEECDETARQQGLKILEKAYQVIEKSSSEPTTDEEVKQVIKDVFEVILMRLQLVEILAIRTKFAEEHMCSIVGDMMKRVESIALEVDNHTVQLNSVGADFLSVDRSIDFLQSQIDTLQSMTAMRH